MFRFSFSWDSEFFGSEISGPFTIPSGVIATTVPVMKRIMDIPEIGIITTKSIGLAPRDGNREPIITKQGSVFSNAVGLRNPGAAEFASQLADLDLPSDKFLLASIFGKDEKEFFEVARTLFPYVNGFELNISCPHAKGYGQSVAGDLDLVSRIVKSVKKLGKPVLVKVSPNVPIQPLVRTCLEAGCDGFSAINTVGPGIVIKNNIPVLSNTYGGLSGPPILPIGLRVVRQIRELTDKPIIGMGGISTARDVLAYKAAGANFFGIGSALAGMSTPEIKHYFSALSLDLENGTSTANRYLKLDRVDMEFQSIQLERKENLSQEMFLLMFDSSIGIRPGQFIFLYLPGFGEKPFSVLDDDPLVVLVRKRGILTSRLSKLGKGDTVYMRGPYGHPPEMPVNSRLLLVGGGTGVAGLYLFAKHYSSVSLLGARTKGELAYLEKFGEVGRVKVATEDGSLGEKGFVTKLIPETMEKEDPDFVINCGPPPMMEAAMRIEREYMESSRILASVDYTTMCGIGLCGTCSTRKGYRLCVDGPVLEMDKIL